jgi:valyl-tRNA synthetase
MRCPYPKAEENDSDEIITSVDWIQKLIITIRTLRAESQISPAKKITVSIQASKEETMRIESYAPWIKSLCRLETLSLNESSQTISKNTATSLMDSLKIHIPLDGLVDVEAEKSRLEKISAKLWDEISRLEIKLQNAKFIQSAPQAVIEKERLKLTETQTQYQELEKKRASYC